MLALVAAGLGVALLPRLATAALPPRVSTVPLTGTPIRRQIFTAHARSRRPPVAAAFDDLLRA